MPWHLLAPVLLTCFPFSGQTYPPPTTAEGTAASASAAFLLEVLYLPVLPGKPPGPWRASSRLSEGCFGPLSFLTGEKLRLGLHRLAALDGEVLSHFSKVFPQLLFILNDRQLNPLASVHSPPPAPHPHSSVNFYSPIKIITPTKCSENVVN